MNPKHLEVVKQGAEAINVWQAEYDPIAELAGAGKEITRLNLTEANLTGADLRGAILSMADLTGANLTGADLTGAILSMADLTRVHLNGAHLNGANLTRAYLNGAHLNGADLAEANFMMALCLGTVFADVDLSLAKGLETVRHLGPSTIGVDTLYRSGGKIPEAFLRGCGVPEEFITYIPSHFGAQQAIQFYSCFISYSHQDEAFAKRLFSRLRDAGLRVWYAPEEMKGGRKLHEQIEEGIRLHDKLLLVLSEASLASEWVATEIRNAREKERQDGRQKLFPIRLVPFDPHIKKWKCFDADSGKDMGVEIREYFIPDFEGWKHEDAFEAGMTRLLNDLRASEKSEKPAA